MSVLSKDCREVINFLVASGRRTLFRGVRVKMNSCSLKIELEDWTNFKRLVLGCIDADVHNHRFVGKILAKAIRLSYFTSPIATCQQMLGNCYRHFQYGIGNECVARCANFVAMSDDFNIFSDLFEKDKHAEDTLQLLYLEIYFFQMFNAISKWLHGEY